MNRDLTQVSGSMDHVQARNYFADRQIILIHYESYIGIGLKPFRLCFLLGSSFINTSLEILVI